MKKKILIGVFGLVVLAIIGAVSAILMTGAPKKTATTFLENISQGKVSEAYSLTSLSFQQQYSKDQYEKHFSDNQSLFSQIIENKINEISVSNDQAEARGFIKNSGGLKAPVIIKLVKEQGSWKVSEFDFQFGAAVKE